jgi:hypothetical protein
MTNAESGARRKRVIEGHDWTSHFTLQKQVCYNTAKFLVQSELKMTEVSRLLPVLS